MWVLGILVTLLVGTATAVVAEGKGQSALLWFIVGLFAPVAGLLIAVLALRPAGATSQRMPTAEEAARESPVTRLLASDPGLSAHAVAERTGSNERQTVEHLVALRSLGFADRDDGGRWRLTDDGSDALVT